MEIQPIFSHTSKYGCTQEFISTLKRNYKKNKHFEYREDTKIPLKHLQLMPMSMTIVGPCDV